LLALPTLSLSYPFSLPDALPISMQARMLGSEMKKRGFTRGFAAGVIAFGSVLTPTLPPGIGMIIYGSIGDVSIGRLFAAGIVPRSEEHTSELQSRFDLVCRLLLE